MTLLFDKSGIVRFYVQLDTLNVGHFGDDFMGQMSQPTAS